MARPQFPATQGLAGVQSGSHVSTLVRPNLDKHELQSVRLWLSARDAARRVRSWSVWSWEVRS